MFYVFTACTTDGKDDVVSIGLQFDSFRECCVEQRLELQYSEERCEHRSLRASSLESTSDCGIRYL
jgi:hypothetical protein